MSSPFQQSFMGKHPFKTIKRMTDAVRAADEKFYEDIDPYEAEGNRMEAAEQSKPLAIDDKTSYDYDYDQNPETTANVSKKKSPLNNSSPLHGAYTSGTDGAANTYRPSDRPAFEALQGKISANTEKIATATKKKKSPGTTTANELDKSTEALNATIADNEANSKLKANRDKTLQENTEAKYVDGRWVRVDKNNNFYNMAKGGDGGEQIGSLTGKKNIYQLQKEKEDRSVEAIKNAFYNK
jgi:hypothetical protein